MEIDGVWEVYDNYESVDYAVEPHQDFSIPSFVSDSYRQHGEQYEQAVHIEYRNAVEDKCAGQQWGKFFGSYCSDGVCVDYVEYYGNLIREAGAEVEAVIDGAKDATKSNGTVIGVALTPATVKGDVILVELV